MAAQQKRKISFSSSDFRGLRASWLSKLFVVDMSSRVKCSEVSLELTNAFQNISLRECGFIVRQCFPNVKRIHSNHVYYYEGIRRVISVDNLQNDMSLLTESGSEKTQGQVVQPKKQKINEHEIPPCMHINRKELLPKQQKKPGYNFANGNFSHLELKDYREYPVAVRAYERNITKEAKVILSLPSHPCLPVLIGVCCDTKPYLLVTMFYGSTRRGVYLTLTGLLTSSGIDIIQLITIFLGIVEGLHLMHSSGFVHGALKAENIMLRKLGSKPKKYLPVLLNLEEAKPLDKDTNASAYKHDIEMFGSMIESIAMNYNFESGTDLSELIKLSQLVRTVELDLTKIIIHIKKNQE